MDLPVYPPVALMLARLTRELPTGPGLSYEPKWDGFRCLAFRDGDDVELRSRHDRPLARYFPEVVGALRAVGVPRLVVDGELLVTRAGRPDFAALLGRLHPAASRVTRLAARHRRRTPSSTSSRSAARTCATSPSGSAGGGWRRCRSLTCA